MKLGLLCTSLSPICWDGTGTVVERNGMPGAITEVFMMSLNCYLHSQIGGCANISFFLPMAGLVEEGVWEGGAGVLRRLVGVGEGVRCASECWSDSTELFSSGIEACRLREGWGELCTTKGKGGVG